MTASTQETRGAAAERSVELEIGGMTCAACVGRVERKLGKVVGVRASVNLATERALVAVPGGVEDSRLIEAVENAGYTARVVDPNEVQLVHGPDPLRSVRIRLTVALVLFVPLADLSLAMSLVPDLRFPYWQVVIAVLAAPVVIWAAWPIHRTAVRGLRHGSTSMDTLVSLGTIVSSAWSVYGLVITAGNAPVATGWEAVLHPDGSLYLEVAAGVVTFVLAGRYFEARARRRAGDVMRSLSLLRPDEVTLLDGESERRLPAALLRVGDRFVVRPGERIAVDGTIESGSAAVDTSAMTGEPVPVEVGPGDTVLGGTIAFGGRLVVRAEQVGADTRLGRMITAVERAQAEKSAAQRLADRISAVFVPVVLVVAVGTLAGWLLISGDVAAGISAAVAVVIIACPCALGLATPTALMVAAGRGAELGIFLKGHRTLETVRAVDTVVLDKTGTLTEGRMRVAEIACLEGVDVDVVLRAAGAVERASEHTIARAVVEYATERIGQLPAADGFVATPGLGASGVVDGTAVAVGRPDDVPAALTAQVQAWEAEGSTVVAVSLDGPVVAVIGLFDPVPESSRVAVAGLRARGLRPILLTGDSAAAAAAAAAKVGIDEVHARVLPDEKVGVIERLRAEGRVVAMVGDGVNDAAALAAADLGIAVGSGTDIALEAADLVLVRDELSALVEAVDLAAATLATIRGNLWWAFGYNVAAIPLAAAGLLNPLLAGAAMALSSLLVVTNSLRLRTA